MGILITCKALCYHGNTCQIISYIQFLENCPFCVGVVVLPGKMRVTVKAIDSHKTAISHALLDGGSSK